MVEFPVRGSGGGDGGEGPAREDTVCGQEVHPLRSLALQHFESEPGMESILPELNLENALLTLKISIVPEKLDQTMTAFIKIEVGLDLV